LRRKETFKNTTEDSFHCSFATICNFYVTNDIKTFNKAKKVYQKLNLNTIVLKPDEFVIYFNNYLNFTNDKAVYYLISEVLKPFEFYEESRPDSKLRIYFLPYFLFDFFNKIMVIINEKEEVESVILSRNNPTHNFILDIEIQKLISRLIINFGTDLENFGEINEIELNDEEWKGRKWNNENIDLALQRLNGHFQFYLNFGEEILDS
jgi:hypothetical protein